MVTAGKGCVLFLENFLPHLNVRESAKTLFWETKMDYRLKRSASLCSAPPSPYPALTTLDVPDMMFFVY